MGEPLAMMPGMAPVPEQGLNPLNKSLTQNVQSLAAPDSNPIATMADVFTYGAQAAVINTVDVFASSMPGNSLERGDINAMAAERFPDLGQFTKENIGGISLVSEFAASFLPISLAVKAVRGYKVFSRVTGINAPWAKALFSSGKTNKELQAAFRAEKEALGELGFTGTTGSTTTAKIKAFGTLSADLVKESIAVDVALYATMNESDVIWPDTFGVADYAKLTGGVTLAVGALQATHLSYLMRGASIAGAKLAKNFLNEHNVNALSVGGFNPPGNRGGSLTQLHDAKASLKEVTNINQTATGSAIELERIAAQDDKLTATIAAIDNRQNETVAAMFADTVTPELGTKQVKFNDFAAMKPYTITVDEALAENSRNFIGVTSFQKLDPKHAADLNAGIASIREKLNEAAAKGRAEDVADGFISKKTSALISELQAKAQISENTTLQILTADGAFLPEESLWGQLQYVASPVTTSKIDNGLGGLVKNYNFIEQSKTLNRHAGFGVSASEQGLITFSKAEITGTERIIDGQNVTKILGKSTIEEINARAAKGYEAYKNDLTKEWHPHGAEIDRPGNSGSKIFNNLSTDAATIQNTWKGSPQASGIRAQAENNTATYQELYGAWTPWRDQWAGISDASGTVTLYRGEKPAEIASWKSNPAGINDIVSMTSNISTAQKFAGAKGRVITRQVPIEDFIMPSGLQNEYELVVKGNRARVQATEVTTKGDIIVHEAPINTAAFLSKDATQTKHAYAVLSKAAEGHDLSTILYVSPNDHFTKLDFVQEVAAQHGSKAQIKFVGGFNDLRDVELSSYLQKFDSYSTRMDMREAYLKGKVKLSKTGIVEERDIARFVNLPTTSTGEMHPTVQMFSHFYATKTDPATVFKSMDELQMALKMDKYIPEKYSQIFDNAEPVRLRGTMLAGTKDKKPVLMYSLDTPATDYTATRILEKQERDFNIALDTLRQPADLQKKGSPLIRIVMGVLDGDAARVKAARNVEAMTTEGMRNNPIMSQEMVAGENTALVTARQLEQITDRQARPWIAQQLEKHQAVISKILKPGNESLLMEVNLWRHARAQRWDVARKEATKGDKFGLTLTKTENNRQLWADTYGGEMPKDAVMPAPQFPRKGQNSIEYVPFWVSKETFDWARAETSMRETVLTHMNLLRKAEGKNPITRREWSVFPVNFSDKATAYVIDISTGAVRGMATGATPRQARIAAEKARASAGTGFVVKSHEELQKQHAFEDELFGNMENYSITGKQPGGKATGASVTDLALRTGDQGILDASRSFVANMESIVRRTRAAYFAPQLNYVRAINHADASTTAITGKLLKEQGGTVFQHYVDAIYGRPTLNVKDIPGKFMEPLANTLDDLIKGIWAKKQEIAGVLKNQSKAEQAAAKANAALVDHLGVEYNPFGDTANYMLKTEKIKVPPSIQGVLSKLQNYTVAVMLRIINPSHGILNMVSLGATLPGVTAGLRQGANEATETWLSRIAAHSSTVDGRTMQLDLVKSLTDTWHKWYNVPKFRDMMKRAGDTHYFDQEVAESIRTLTAPMQGWHENLLKRGIDHLSIISDKTEKWSRAISFAVGANIAEDVLRLKGDDAIFSFAHEFANKNIGNYATSNKPKIFQGAAGMPLGLFQTFAWNYYQRLFSYIERGDKRAIAVQYAMQTALFGAQSVPGWDVFTQTFATNYDGSTNVIDGIRNKVGDGPLGRAAVDTFMYGSLSVLPRAFGSDGLSISSRGDMNPRHIPNILQLGDLPQVRLMQNTAEIVSRTISAVSSEAGWSADQQAEILGQFSSMRIVQGLAQLYTGEETDRRARLIDGDVRTKLGVIARMLTLRPLKSAITSDVMFRSDRIAAANRTKMQRLDEQASAIVRSGASQEELNKQLSAVALDAMKYSITPANVGVWMLNKARSAQTERSSAMFLRIAKDQHQMSIVKRLIELNGSEE